MGIVGNRDDALDVVQESFVKAYYKLKEFRFGSNFYTWFYRLLVNQAIDRWRKSSRSAEVPLDESWLSEDASPPDSFAYPTTPEELLMNRELGDALQKAIAALSEHHRAVILLREVDGMAYEDIAKTLGCSTGTVMSRLHYAREKLKERPGAAQGRVGKGRRWIAGPLGKGSREGPTASSRRGRRRSSTPTCPPARRARPSMRRAAARGAAPARPWPAPGPHRRRPALDAMWTRVRAGIAERGARAGAPSGAWRWAWIPAAVALAVFALLFYPAGMDRSPFNPSTFDVSVEDVESDVATVALVDKGEDLPRVIWIIEDAKS